MENLKKAEDRGYARRLLADAYLADVELLAQEMCARIRRGEFDKNYSWFSETLRGAVERHPRVTDQMLVFETIAFSQHRDAIEEDFVEGYFDDELQKWVRLEGAFDREDKMWYTLNLPPWPTIAYHAFFRDVSERLYANLGDTPEQYIATRLGHSWS